MSSRKEDLTAVNASRSESPQSTSEVFSVHNLRNLKCGTLWVQKGPDLIRLEDPKSATLDQSNSNKEDHK